MNHPEIATWEQTCFGCPDQYEGRLDDGTYFYLRYRWGVASLGLGELPDLAVRDRHTVSVDLGDGLVGVFESPEQRDATFARLLRKHRARAIGRTLVVEAVVES